MMLTGTTAWDTLPAVPPAPALDEVGARAAASRSQLYHYWADALVGRQVQHGGRGGCPIANLVGQVGESDDR